MSLFPKTTKDLAPAGGGPLAMPFRGGAVTSREPASLPLGALSMLQNMRSERPGFRKRLGQRRIHSTADADNIVNIFHWTKEESNEDHLLAQYEDGALKEASNAIPDSWTGIFGSDVLAGTTTDYPASFSSMGNFLLYSNGVDQHQIWSGDETRVANFMVCTDCDELLPKKNIDYTSEVQDDNDSTVAVLDSLDTYVNDECVFVRTDIPADTLSITLNKPNGTSSVLSVYYWNGAWTSASATDGTADTGVCLAVDGDITWTHPSDEVPCYLFGRNGFWYQIRVSVQLDAEVEISKATYASDMQDIRVIWDGYPVYAVEAQLYVAASTNYKRYSSASVDLLEMTTSDILYIASAYPACGIYIDVGAYPNSAASTIANTNVSYWNGASWSNVSATNFNDGTSGLSQSGWILFQQQSDVQPTQFNDGQYHAYWYRLTIGTAAATDNGSVTIKVMPFYDIADFGNVGYVSVGWKKRALYNNGDRFFHVSAPGKPFVLSGSQYYLFEAGDGRPNRITCVRKFYNELITWQEEKGTEGGCVTLLQGNDPSTFGTQLLSTVVGTYNNKSAVVVEGTSVSTQTDERFAAIAYFWSRLGLVATDANGMMQVISDDIGNFFFDPENPDSPEQIRPGHENDHFLHYDQNENVLRGGIICGHTEDQCDEDNSSDWDMAVDSVNSSITFDTDHYELSSNGDANEIFYIAGTFRRSWNYQVSVQVQDGTETSENFDIVNIDGDGTVEDYTSGATTGSWVTHTHLFQATNDTAGIGIRIPADLAGDNIEIKAFVTIQLVYPVYDLIEKVWSFDTMGQNIACMCQAEASSGNRGVLQMGGGRYDGYAYELNYGKNDVSSGIDAAGIIELNYQTFVLKLFGLVMRMKTQSAGSITITPLINGVRQTALARTLSMTAQVTNEKVIRQKSNIQVDGENLSIEYKNSTASQGFHLIDIMLLVYQMTVR